MSFSVSQIQTKLQPWLHINFDSNRIKWIYDSALYDHINQVADDINVDAMLKVERFYMNGDPAETNYTLDYEIHRILDFFYRDANFTKQRWVKTYSPGTSLLSTIVLKNAPTNSSTLIDITYLRKIAKVEAVSDEVDIDDLVFTDFMDLLKARLDCDYNGQDETVYQTKRRFVATQVFGKMPYQYKPKIKKNFIYTQQDYDIRKMEVGIENILLNESTSKYEWIGYTTP